MKLIAASCANNLQVHPQPVWAEIEAERPDVLLLLGDNVYLSEADPAVLVDPIRLAGALRSVYARQWADPHFSGLLTNMQARGGRVLAVYDDHDFLGDNRLGGDAPEALRQTARAEFFRALGQAGQVPGPGGELYGAHAFGRVDLLLLDTRYHRLPPEASGQQPDAVLGAAQWAWLQSAVATARAPYLVLASSSTVHAFGGPCWEDYPAAFERLRALLRGRTGALVLSGDAHRNAAYDESGIVELVTSAVAQRSLRFGVERQNYVVLRFEASALQVALRSLKAGSRFQFSIPLAHWQLP